MALALSWTGYADTDVSFAEFAADDHSILLRFMAQYLDAYEGPFVADNGPAHLPRHGRLQGGDESHDETHAHGGDGRHELPDQHPARDLVPRRRNRSGDGDDAYVPRVPQVGAQMSVPASAAAAPQGTLRIGKRTIGQTLYGRNGQFYGLIDDVAAYTRMLDAREIASIASGQPQLTGSESGLLAACAAHGSMSWIAEPEEALVLRCAVGDS